MNLNFDRVNLENVGDWPMPVKAIIAGAAAVLIAINGYRFSTSVQLNKLDKEHRRLESMKRDYEKKQRYASSLDAYRQQLKEIKQTFGHMLQKLPETTEVPGLIEEISEIGNKVGLDFSLIKPLQEVQHDFYAELPIEISVRGNYHQFANFVSRLANIKRIVTLHDFMIEDVAAEEEASRPLLQMAITAKTYRYMAVSRVQPEKKDDKRKRRRRNRRRRS